MDAVQTDPQAAETAPRTCPTCMGMGSFPLPPGRALQRHGRAAVQCPTCSGTGSVSHAR